MPAPSGSSAWSRAVLGGGLGARATGEGSAGVDGPSRASGAPAPGWEDAGRGCPREWAPCSGLRKTFGSGRRRLAVLLSCWKQVKPFPTPIQAFCLWSRVPCYNSPRTCPGGFRGFIIWVAANRGLGGRMVIWAGYLRFFQKKIKKTPGGVKEFPAEGVTARVYSPRPALAATPSAARAWPSAAAGSSTVAAAPGQPRAGHPAPAVEGATPRTPFKKACIESDEIALASGLWCTLPLSKKQFVCSMSVV